MPQSIPLLTLTIIATGALTASRFVGHDGDVAAAAGNTLGVARADAAIGDAAAVDTHGTAIVEAGAAIAAGAAIEVDATGRAVTKSAGVTVARLAPGESAGAAGDLVEAILFPN
ncbi:capsid cement protein [Sedimenticola hydrogenitrophicus]|uniref:capsid cement protein n=1 Tax=Sedimenticola hydrogenitrophicus TaxID=2967975 RepID=UPI0023B1C784|nr:capsid cement protein [Sedimenticola hydrogenitrophicus]